MTRRNQRVLKITIKEDINTIEQYYLTAEGYLRIMHQEIILKIVCYYKNGFKINYRKKTDFIVQKRDWGQRESGFKNDIYKNDMGEKSKPQKWFINETCWCLNNQRGHTNNKSEERLG